MTLFELFEGNLPHKRQTERDREREQASWMPNDMVTAGNREPQAEFPSSALSFCECAQQYLLGLHQV